MFKPTMICIPWPFYAVITYLRMGTTITFNVTRVSTEEAYLSHITTTRVLADTHQQKYEERLS